VSSPKGELFHSPAIFLPSVRAMGATPPPAGKERETKSSTPPACLSLTNDDEKPEEGASGRGPAAQNRADADADSDTESIPALVPLPEVIVPAPSMPPPPVPPNRLADKDTDAPVDPDDSESREEQSSKPVQRTSISFDAVLDRERGENEVQVFTQGQESQEPSTSAVPSNPLCSNGCEQDVENGEVKHELSPRSALPGYLPELSEHGPPNSAPPSIPVPLAPMSVNEARATALGRPNMGPPQIPVPQAPSDAGEMHVVELS